MKFVDVPLFPLPEVPAVQLSRLNEDARLRPGDAAPKWTEKRLKNPVPCDECAARQHETRGNSGPRASARVRRTVRSSRVLDLCRSHEDLWKARDTADAASH